MSETDLGITSLWENLGPIGRFAGVVLGLVYAVSLLMAFISTSNPFFMTVAYAVPSLVMFVLVGAWAIFAFIILVIHLILFRPFGERERFFVVFFPLIIGLVLMLFLGAIRLLATKEVLLAEPSENPVSGGDK